MDIITCPDCGTSENVHATEKGYLCALCLAHWPYDHREACCEPDFDYEKGKYVHGPDCRAWFMAEGDRLRELVGE